MTLLCEFHRLLHWLATVTLARALPAGAARVARPPTVPDTADWIEPTPPVNQFIQLINQSTIHPFIHNIIFCAADD